MKQANGYKFVRAVVMAVMLFVMIASSSALGHNIGALNFPETNSHGIYAFPQVGPSRKSPTVGQNPPTAAQCTPGVADLTAEIGSQQNQNGLDPVKLTSPSNTYGQDGHCFRGYLQVEATNTSGLNVIMVGHWGDYPNGNPRPTTKTSCIATRADAQFWGHKDNKWELLGSSSSSGTWNSVTGKCNIPIASRLVQNSPYSKLQVITRARAFSPFGLAPRKVTGYLDNLGW